MADRWMDREDRDWREHQRRTQRAGREDYGSGDYAERDYALGDYDSGYRSFEPQDRDRDRGRPRGPVFGERETGANYAGGGGYGGQARYNARDADRTRGGRAYGDDGRGSYRGDFTSPSPGERTYSDYRTQRSGFERDYPVERTHREPYRSEGGYDRGDTGGNGRSFWDRASERVASWFGEFDDDRGDVRQAGHRGRGPQGYKRSDERINEDIHERLTDDVYLDASHIEVKVHGGEATLTGSVADRGAKHRAEQIVERVSGVDHVQNNLRVDTRHFFTTAGPGFGDSASEALARSTSDDLTLNTTAKSSGRTQ